MHRTEGTYSVNGTYVEGPPATIITASAMNAIQEEIATVIENAGFDLLKSSTDTYDQLWNALVFLTGTDVQTVTTNTGMSTNTNYIVNATSRLSLTLPTTSSVGDMITIADRGSRGFKVTQNANQNILYKNQSTVPGTVGYIQTKTGYASMKLECIVANTTWQVVELRDVVQMKGYCMGGSTGAVTAVIEDLNFQYESSKTIAATLDTAKYAGAGVSSNTKGYIMGGNTGAVTAVIEDLIFSDETSQAIAATLDTAKQEGAGVSSNTKGYIMGGFDAAVTSDIEDLIFSDETSQAIVATLDTAKQECTGVSSNLKGYIMGGYTIAPARVDVIEDLIFSDESSQAIAATLDGVKTEGVGVYSNLKGYIMGGDNAGALTVIEDLIFSDESSQAITATLDTSSSNGAGNSSALKGYKLGGTSGGLHSIIEDLEFITESSRAITATLDTAKADIAGIQGYN